MNRAAGRGYSCARSLTPAAAALLAACGLLTTLSSAEAAAAAAAGKTGCPCLSHCTPESIPVYHTGSSSGDSVCYRMVSFANANWADAQRVCRQDGGRLAEPRSAAEVAFLWSTVSNEFQYVWVGGRAAVAAGSDAASWGWASDGAAVAAGVRPSAAAQDGACAFISERGPGSGGLFSWVCTATMAFICEKPRISFDAGVVRLTLREAWGARAGSPPVRVPLAGTGLGGGGVYVTHARVAASAEVPDAAAQQAACAAHAAAAPIRTAGDVRARMRALPAQAAGAHVYTPPETEEGGAGLEAGTAYAVCWFGPLAADGTVASSAPLALQASGVVVLTAGRPTLAVADDTLVLTEDSVRCEGEGDGARCPGRTAVAGANLEPGMLLSLGCDPGRFPELLFEVRAAAGGGGGGLSVVFNDAKADFAGLSPDVLHDVCVVVWGVPGGSGGSGWDALPRADRRAAAARIPQAAFVSTPARVVRRKAPGFSGDATRFLTYYESVQRAEAVRIRIATAGLPLAAAVPGQTLLLGLYASPSCAGALLHHAPAAYDEAGGGAPILVVDPAAAAAAGFALRAHKLLHVCYAAARVPVAAAAAAQSGYPGTYHVFRPTGVRVKVADRPRIESGTGADAGAVFMRLAAGGVGASRALSVNVTARFLSLPSAAESSTLFWVAYAATASPDASCDDTDAFYAALGGTLAALAVPAGGAAPLRNAATTPVGASLTLPPPGSVAAGAAAQRYCVVLVAAAPGIDGFASDAALRSFVQARVAEDDAGSLRRYVIAAGVRLDVLPPPVFAAPEPPLLRRPSWAQRTTASGSGSGSNDDAGTLALSGTFLAPPSGLLFAAVAAESCAAAASGAVFAPVAAAADASLALRQFLPLGAGSSSSSGSASVHAVCWRYDAAAAPEGVANAWRDTGDTVVVVAPPVVQRYVSAAAAPGAKQTVAAGELDARLDIPVFGQLLPNGTAIGGVLTYSLERQPPGSGGDGGLHGPYVLRCAPASMDGAFPDLPAASYGRPPFCSSAVVAIGGTAAAAGSLLPPNTYKLLERRGQAAAATDTGVTVVVGPRPEVSAAAVQTLAHDALAECAAGTREAAVQVSVRHHTPRLTLGIRLDGETAVLALGAPTTVPPSGEGVPDPSAAVSVAFQMPRAVCGEVAALLAARRAASDAGGGTSTLDARYELVWGHGDRPGFSAAVEGGGGAAARLLGKGRPLFARTVPSAEALRVDAGLAALFRRDAAGGAAVALGGAVDTLNADQALLGVLCEHPSCGYAACAGSGGVLLFDLSTPAQAGASPILRLPFAYSAARGDRSLFVCWAAAYGGSGVAPPQAPRALSTAAWAAELVANPALDAAARRMRPARVTVSLPGLPRFAAAAALPALRYTLLPHLVAELPGVFPEAAAAAIVLHLAPAGGSCGAADAPAPLSAAATKAAGPTSLNVTAAELLAPAVLPGTRYPVCYSVVAAANAAAAAASFPSQHRLYHALTAGSLVFEHVAAPAPMPVVAGGGALVVRIVDAAVTAAGGGTRVLLRGAGLTPDVVAREAMPDDVCEAGYAGDAKWVFDVQAAAVPASAGSGGGLGDATAFFTHRAGGTAGTTLSAAYSGGARRLCWGVRRLAGGSDASVVTWLPGGSPFTYQAPPAFRNANLPLARESLLGFAAAGGGGYAANTAATAEAWGSGLGVAAPFYVYFVPPVRASGGVVDAAASCAAAASGGSSNLHGFLVDEQGTLHLPPALSTHLFYSGSSGTGPRAVCWAGSSSGASFLQATAATMTAPATPAFITATAEVAAVRLLELFKRPAAPSLFGFLVDMQGGPDASTALKYWLSLGTTHHSPTNAATTTDEGLAEQPLVPVDAATHSAVSTFYDAQLSTDTAAVAGYLQRALLTGEAAEGAAAGRRVEVSLRLWWGLAGADGQWRASRDGRAPLVLRGRTAAEPHVASVRRVWQIPRVSGAVVRLKGVAGAAAAAAALRVEEAPGLGSAPPLLPPGAWHDASGGAALGAFFDARVAAAGPDAAAFASVLCRAGAVDALGLRAAAAGAAVLRLSAADVAALSGGIVVSRVAGAGHAVTADVHGLAADTAYVVLTGVLARAAEAANSPVLFHPFSVFPVTVHPSTDTAAPPTSEPTPVPADATPSPTPVPPPACDEAGEAAAATRVSEVCNRGELRQCLAPAAQTPAAQCAAAYTTCAAREQAAAEAELRCAVAAVGAGTPVRGHVVLSVSVDAFDATLFRAALAEADDPRRLPQRFGVVRVSPGSAVVEFTAPSLDVLGKKLAEGGADAPASLFQAYNWSVLGYSDNGTGGLTAAPQVVELPAAEDSDDKMRLVLFVGLGALLCVVLVAFALLVRCCCRVERAVEETKKQIEDTVAAQQARAQQPADECEVTVEFSDEEGDVEAAAAAAAAAAPKPQPRGPPVPPRRSESRSRAGSEDTQPAPGAVAASAVSVAATPSLTVTDGSGGGGGGGGERLQRLRPTDDPFASGPTEPTSAATNLSKVKGISRKPDGGSGGGGFADLFRTAAAGAPAEHPFKPAFAAAAAHVQAQAQAGPAAHEPQSNGGRFDFFRTAQPKLPAASSVSAPASASAPSTTIVSVPSRSAASAPIPAPNVDGSLLSRLAAHPDTVARVHSSKPRGLRSSLSSAQQPHEYPSASARPQTSLGLNSSIVSVPSHQSANTTTISVPSVSAATDYPPVFVSGSSGPPQPPPRHSLPTPPPHAHARPQPAEPQARGGFLTPPAASLSTASGMPCCHHCGHPWNGGAFCAYCGRQSA